MYGVKAERKRASRSLLSLNSAVGTTSEVKAEKPCVN